MGQSQPIGLPLRLELMADDALALLNTQGWISAHVVGHSMGGLIAQHLALSAPSRVRSLALLCTFSRGRDATRLTPWMLWTGLRTRMGTRRQRRHAFLRLVVPPNSMSAPELDSLADRWAPVFGHDLAVQPPIAMKQLQAMNAYDTTPHLGRLSRIPTLVVSAAHDRIARPELGRALATGIPGARYVEIPDAAHGVTISRADAINTLLLEHLSAVEAKTS
jgi:pimeloyl-ACP methyl ester carboxylesterase